MSGTGPSGLEVFAVEDTTAQVAWSRLPTGRWRLAAGDTHAEIEADGGPGVALLIDLPPATDLALRARGPGDERERAAARFATLAPPPGRLLTRVATVNDTHIGGPRFGWLPAARLPDDGGEPPPERCLRAAAAEMVAWGAQLVVAKGDLTDHGWAEEGERAAELLASAGLPVEGIPGNHDVSAGSFAGADGFARRGMRVTIDGVAHLDLAGLRVVLVDTTVPASNEGRVEPRREETARLLGEAGGGALLALHHHPQRFSVPLFWPPGIPGPEARRFLDAVAAANPATLVASGHTHRHRRRGHGPLVLAEVGSTKDYPGTWTGYAVYEGGIRQVTRRVAAPGAVRWTESTRRVFAGTWGRWSAGSLDDRCFSLTWPAR